MVERLKDAIERARQQRARLQGETGPAPRPGGGLAPATGGPRPPGLPWATLEALSLTPRRLQRNRVITLDRSDPAHVAFDVLRSRILKAFQDNGWSRLAITSPTKGCGKTFVSVNLALSLARQPDLRTLLVDLDLRAPQVAATLGLGERRAIRDFLTGSTAPESYIRRLGDNLAVALNTERVRNAAELLLERKTASILTETIGKLAPDIVIYDLPPMLVSDDAFAFLPHVDAVLLVAAAGETRAAQIDACEQLFQGNAAFLGVLLNKVEDTGSEDSYDYGYHYA